MSLSDGNANGMIMPVTPTGGFGNYTGIDI